MDMWISEKECTGCETCANSCPKNAITMAEDIYGFKKPIIDKEKCINCGACKSSCPIIEKVNLERFNKPDVFAAWSNDEDNRFYSTSGGIFFELSKNIINKGGIVVGAKYNNDNMVEHSIATNIEELSNLRQSKYLQSNINFIFKKIREYLNNGILVAFCGTPCQVAGLYKFLKKEYDNLLTFEFICRGVNSPKAFRTWISELEEKNGSKIKKIWFKYKINGWKKSPRCTKYEFDDGNSMVLVGDEDLYMTGYLAYNLYIRPCCSKCHFKDFPRQADITLADFWGINKELDDDKGTSLLLINSIKGQKYFTSISNKIRFYKKEFSDVISGNACVSKSIKINKKSKKFLKKLGNNNFSIQLKKYGREPILIRLKIFIKAILPDKIKNKLKK